MTILDPCHPSQGVYSAIGGTSRPLAPLTAAWHRLCSDTVSMTTSTKPPSVSATTVRAVIQVLADTYHGRGSVELGDPYKVLVATVISARTREEQTIAVSERVFARYRDAFALAEASEQELYNLMEGSQYRETKTPRLIQMARILVEKHGGKVPNSAEALLELPGVGRKTANCVLIYAFDIPALCVDIHMHRITNRLGWVHTKTPEQTEKALEKIIPKDLWTGVNRLFLQHGRAICTPGVPACTRCPVRRWCAYGNDPGTPKR
jgi:endonuclease-3